MGYIIMITYANQSETEIFILIFFNHQVQTEGKPQYKLYLFMRNYHLFTFSVSFCLANLKTHQTHALFCWLPYFASEPRVQYVSFILVNQNIISKNTAFGGERSKKTCLENRMLCTYMHECMHFKIASFLLISSVQLLRSCPTFCNTMDCITGFPVHHQHLGLF